MIASSPDPTASPAPGRDPSRGPGAGDGDFVSRPGAPIGVFIDPGTGLVRAAPAGVPMALPHAGAGNTRTAGAFAVFVIGAAIFLSVTALVRWRPGAASAEVGVALLLGAAANVELGRALDGAGGSRRGPHRGLAAWPFAAALLLAPGMAGVVAAFAYIHAQLRGGRIRGQRALLSWAAVTVAATTAGVWRMHLLGGAAPWSGPPWAAAVLVSAVGVFLAVELGVIAVGARLSPPAYAEFLRRWLSGPRFALTEAGVVGTGALSAVVCAYWPGFVLLLVPLYALMQRALLHPSVRHAARHDSKTGLLTCETWYRAAEKALERARRGGGEAALLLVDLDDFKRINDRHGHLVGDRVLASVGRELLDVTRGVDLVGRFGGDEFSLLLAGTGRAAAAGAAERVRAGIAALRLPGVASPVTASVGVALFDGRGSLAELLNRADESLYEAKRGGRDRVGH